MARSSCQDTPEHQFLSGCVEGKIKLVKKLLKKNPSFTHITDEVGLAPHAYIYRTLAMQSQAGRLPARVGVNVFSLHALRPSF